MASQLIRIDAKFPRWAERFQAMMPEILLFIAAQLQTNRGLMFDNANQGRPTPWKDPLLRDGQPLSARGTLRKSWAPNTRGNKPGSGPGSIVKIQGDIVTIGTSLPYAPILNDGGVIKPLNGKWLWIPIPRGSILSSQAPTDLARSMRKSAGKKPKNTDWKWTKQPGGPIIVLGPGGKAFLLAKQAKIPARPMNEWTQEDVQELSIALRNKYEAILNYER